MCCVWNYEWDILTASYPHDVVITVTKAVPSEGTTRILTKPGKEWGWGGELLLVLVGWGGELLLVISGVGKGVELMLVLVGWGGMWSSCL